MFGLWGIRIKEARINDVLLYMVNNSYTNTPHTSILLDTYWKDTCVLLNISGQFVRRWRLWASRDLPLSGSWEWGCSRDPDIHAATENRFALTLATHLCPIPPKYPILGQLYLPPAANITLWKSLYPPSIIFAGEGYLPDWTCSYCHPANLQRLMPVDTPSNLVRRSIQASPAAAARVTSQY